MGNGAIKVDVGLSAQDVNEVEDAAACIAVVSQDDVGDDGVLRH